MLQESTRAPACRASILRPSLADALFVALLLWMVVYSLSGTGAGLIEDSDTGEHIRTGDYILEHRAVPRQDVLSFTKPGEPWFAWEWLVSATFALLFRWTAMKGLILVSAAVIALAMALLVRQMIARGANAIVALALIHVGIGASSVHFLARPHVFTMLFMVLTMMALDRGRLWPLVPLTIMWVNVHGGFAAAIVTIGVFGVGRAIELRSFQPLLRHAWVVAACLAASLANPYGISEHVHIVKFLRQPWIAEMVEEFQPPKFNSAGGVYIEILLVLAILSCGWLISQSRFAHALAALMWAHFTLTSVRHTPIFAIVALPVVAEAVTAGWNGLFARRDPKAISGVLSQVAGDHAAGLARLSLWTPASIALMWFAPLGIAWPKDFPEAKYPSAFVTRHAGLISGSRIFSTDKWGDYLTFRFYPRQRVFIDGRGDFFGEKFCREYLNAVNGSEGWRQTLDEYGVNAVLVPSPSGLASRLRESGDWSVVEDDGNAALFEKGER